MININPQQLGDCYFKREYRIKYAYLCGGMYKGISSTDLVIKLGKANLMGFFGTGGLKLDSIENSIVTIQNNLKQHHPYGMNLLCNIQKPSHEEDRVNLFLKYKIKYIEAAAFMQIMPSLVLFRLKGLHINSYGEIEAPHHILAKVSRPEVAKAFMSPAPENIVHMLYEKGLLTEQEIKLGESIPIADDICVEADSGGHTDQGVAFALLPAIQTLRDEMMAQFKSLRVLFPAACGVKCEDEQIYP